MGPLLTRLNLAALGACLLVGCGVSPKPAPRESDGPTIVSLNPCTDAILAEVAGDGQLLAVSHYSHDPHATSMPLEQALTYPATGGTVEEVLALDPDVVVAGAFLAPATRNAFERLGVQVETFDPPMTVEESVRQVRRLGALAGQQGNADQLAARITSAWEQAGYAGEPLPTVLLQQGGIVPGPESLIARLMEKSGLSLHSAARGLGQGSYLPLEQVMADPPHLVLASGEERMLDHPVLKARDDMRFDALDPAMLFCGGPTIIRTLEGLAELRTSR